MLLQKIIEKQSQLKENDKQFARRLKVPRSTWQLTRTGLRPLGPTVARAAMRAFPDLTADVVSFLLSDASREAVTGTDVA